MKDKTWKKSDIGKILVYRRETGSNEKIIIYNVDPRVTNTVGFVEYPIILDYRFPSPFLASNFGQAGVVKNKQKQSEESLEKPGDWYLLGKVSKDEMGTLEKLAKTPKRILDEDPVYPQFLNN